MNRLETLAQLIADPTHREKLLQQSEWPAEIFTDLYPEVSFLIPRGCGDKCIYHPDYAHKMVTPAFLKAVNVRVGRIVHLWDIIKKMEEGVFQVETSAFTWEGVDPQLVHQLICQAVEKRPEIIAHVRDLSPELQLLAVNTRSTAVLNIRKPTPEACRAAVQKHPPVIKHLEQTEELCLLALQSRDGWSVSTEDIRVRSPEINTLLVKQFPSVYDTLEDPTDEQTLVYIKHFPHKIAKWSHREDIVLAAIRESSDVPNYLPDDAWTDAVKDLVLSLYPNKISHQVFEHDTERIKKVLIRHPGFFSTVQFWFDGAMDDSFVEIARENPRIAGFAAHDEKDEEILAREVPETLNYMRVKPELFMEVCKAHPEFIPSNIPDNIQDWEFFKTLVRKAPGLLPKWVPSWCDDLELITMIVEKKPSAVFKMENPPQELVEKVIRERSYLMRAHYPREWFMLALSVDGTLLVRIPEEKRDLELCQTAVKQTPEAMRFVPWEHREACWELLSKN